VLIWTIAGNDHVIDDDLRPFDDREAKRHARVSFSVEHRPAA
jgi:hypothetical protein